MPDLPDETRSGAYTSVADIFEEVEEQLRSDRYIAIVKKTWPYAAAVAGAALAIALGIWGFDNFQAGLQAKASESYNAGLEGLARGDKANAEKAFSDVAANGPRGYRTLALMQEGALRLGDHKYTEAVALFDQGAGVAPDKVLGDSARLKAAFAAMDGGETLAQVEARLQPLTAADHPFHLMAREGLAMARLAAGKTADAKADFTALTLAPDATDGSRARAQAALSLIDSGSAANFPAILKIARTLPPPSPADQAAALMAAQAQAQAQQGPQGQGDAQ